MFTPGSPLSRLLSAPMRPGIVTCIGLRPGRREAMRLVNTARLDPLDGLAGDHYRSRTGGNRQVTLIGAAQVDAIAAHLGRDGLDPMALRRNIVVRGISLLALKGTRFRLGTAVLEMTGECHPCSRMEEILGSGGYNAVRGHGGITARIISGGTVRMGDAIEREDPS
jgi:MOSC domain-containing protein YiiM